MLFFKKPFSKTKSFFQVVTLLSKLLMKILRAVDVIYRPCSIPRIHTERYSEGKKKLDNITAAMASQHFHVHFAVISTEKTNNSKQCYLYLSATEEPASRENVFLPTKKLADFMELTQSQSFFLLKFISQQSKFQEMSSWNRC